MQVFASSSPFWGAAGILDDESILLEAQEEGTYSADRQTCVVTLNIDKLIEGLTMKTLCLGSSPGIKRESVR